MTDYKDKLKYITPPNIRRCIFCGSLPPLTGEHIFPQWSHRYLPTDRTNKYESLRGVRLPGQSKHHIIKRPGDIRDWKVSCVCGSVCNNGWMRKEVEERARPVLEDLIQGVERRIMPPEQIAIAAWAVLKCMIAEWTIQGNVTTNHMQRKRLMRRFLPPEKGWGVWIGRFVSDSNELKDNRYLTLWESHPLLILPDRQAASRRDKKATYFNSQSSTQVLGQLLVHTFRSPMPNLIPRWHFTPPDRGTLFRIWPPSQTSIVWPAKTLSDVDAVYTANAFMNFVLNIQARNLKAATG